MNVRTSSVLQGDYLIECVNITLFGSSKGQVRTTCISAILNHLIESNPNNDIKKSFNIVYHKPKLTKIRLLAISEAISIRLCDPELCSQKQLVRTLNLPWPSVESTELYKLNSLRHHRSSNVC